MKWISNLSFQNTSICKNRRFISWGATEIMSFVAKILQVDYMRHSCHILSASLSDTTHLRRGCLHPLSRPYQAHSLLFLFTGLHCSQHLFSFHFPHKLFHHINAAVVTHVLDFSCIFLFSFSYNTNSSSWALLNRHVCHSWNPPLIPFLCASLLPDGYSFTQSKHSPNLQISNFLSLKSITTIITFSLMDFLLLLSLPFCNATAMSLF